MYIMFSTPLTCCSIGAATVSATTWALAPGYVADTSTVGGVISGYWAIGRANTASSPASVTMIDSTEAKMGRFMKKLENIGAREQRTEDRGQKTDHRGSGLRRSGVA